MQRSARGFARWATVTSPLLAFVACGSDPSAGPKGPPPPSVAEQAQPIATSLPDASAPPAQDAGADAAVDAAEEPSEPAPPRVGSVSHFTWIYKAPNRKQQPIGYARPGTSVPLKSTEPVAGSDCSTGRWLRVEPTGYVCNDVTTTLDLDAPLYRALEQVVKPREHVLPYRYGYSTGAPMYGRIPSQAEVLKAERPFVPVDELPRSGKPRTSYEELAEFEAVQGTDKLPDFASPELPRMRGYDAGLVRKTIPAGSLLSFRDAIESGGRTYLLSTDLTLVPADRIRPFRETAFRGVELGGDVTLPVAWTRSAPRAQYKRMPDGGFEATDRTWPPRSLIPITGRRESFRGQTYLETRVDGVWVRDRDASVVEPPERLPYGLRDGDKWIEFSASRGTFTLFVGRNAVYSTLASPGRGGGAPTRDMSVEDLVQGSYTPLGSYRVTFKTFAATMTPEGTPNPQKHWIQDVPYTQYFRRPFAIHTAYWHEDFGMPKSGGCINLSPEDARYVFGWTEPRLPESWSGVSSSKELGLGTTVVIRR